MYFLIYSSYARLDFNNADLKAILTQARDKNKTSGISGMLIFIEGKFIQYLEGEETNVKHLYTKINQDKRHKGVAVLKEGQIDEQLFTNWTMAFSSAIPEELAGEEGFERLKSSSALQVFKKLSTDF